MSTLFARFVPPVLLTLCAVAQQGVILHIRGHITDATTRVAVAGVTVSAVAAKHSVTTDVNGFFSLELRAEIKPGEDVRIHIERAGYRADDLTEAASENVTYPIQISRLGKHPIPKPKPTTHQAVEPFSVEVRSALVSDSGPLTMFMVTDATPLGDTASPVFYLAYIQITNLQDVPSTIDDFKIAASKEPEGQWEDLIPIRLSTHPLYKLGPNNPRPMFLNMAHGTVRLATSPPKDYMKFAGLVKLEPPIESEISKPIAPHQAIRGWVALHSPRHQGLTPGPIYFRMKILDAEKGERRYITELPRSGPGDSTMDINCGVMDITGVSADIRNFKVKYFREQEP